MIMRIYALFPKILNEIFLNRLMHNYKLLVYNFCMKKLLTLLMLSPVLAADIVNLVCTHYSTFDPEAVTVKPITGSFTVSINTDTKEAVTKDGKFKYEEYGDQVWWSAIYVRQIGDTFAMADRFRLNRVTGELEQDFFTWSFPDGIKAEDLIKLRDIDNYDLGLVHSANCEKTESLF